MSTTTLKIPKGNNTHRVEIKKDNRGNIGTTANTWVRVYLNADKYPYVGTLFNDNTPISELIGWAETQINNYPKSETR